MSFRGAAFPSGGVAGGLAGGLARGLACGTARGAPRGLRIESLVALGLASLLALSAVACNTLRAVRVQPVPIEASEAFASAQAELRASALDPQSARLRAREHAEAALAAAPDWVAPARLLDDLLRDDLRGVEALAAHRERLAREGEQAGLLYLIGRLEGEDGEPRYARAAELDPALAWARHGLAWAAERRGDSRVAVGHERAALARARDPWERSFFTSALARFLARAGRREEALSVLEERLEDRRLSAGDRVRLSIESIGIVLERRSSSEGRKALDRGLDLLREEDLSDDEVENLVAQLRGGGGREERLRLELSTALAAKRGNARDRLRAELMLASGPTPLALGLLERSLESSGLAGRGGLVSGPLLRAARFAAGDFVPAIERWLAEVPARLLDAEGLPRDERLAAVVRCARAVSGREPGTEQAEAWFDFAQALLSAGWYREARALAGNLARADLDRALAVEARAAAGMQLLDSLDEVMIEAEESGRSRPGAATTDVGAEFADVGEADARAYEPALRPARAPRDLSELLAAIGPLFARHRSSSGEEVDAEEVRRRIARSPRLEYGPVGEVVHPGPRFSAADESAGLGREGERVPGLAWEMDGIGRFALLGEMFGTGGPDGTVLARLLVEERAGEHLGVAWSGTVAWCEGADVRSRLERRGVRVSAAALHEGYWLDVQAVRGELVLFSALTGAFGRVGSAERAGRTLAVTGLPLASSDPDRRRHERTRVGLALGEASRVRLAILRDRAAPGEDLGEMTLDELVEVTATHEEGHLTDRTRFLPLSRHWGRALAFLLDCGFSPTRCAERLEYRAQLVALCEAEDPRVPLAQALDAVEGEGLGSSTHSAGYEQLLEDFVLELDERIEEKPEAFPAVDPSRTLVHQLHRLGPHEVRGLARRLAKAKGLAD